MFYDQTDADRPQTHALVIGVGGYPHIADGEAPNSDITVRFGELNQLTSAPRSAARFAEWVVEKAELWDAPLGSVDLLISPARGDNFEMPRDREGNLPAMPTRANVVNAYFAWKQRCSQHQDNISVFYFCGHGGQKNFSLYLLCQDFGSAHSIWSGAFDFTETRRAFHTCAAERQLFFIDACRELTLGLLLYQPTATPLEDAPIETNPECRFNFTQFSAPRNAAALGPKQGISYYANALMRALEGAAAKQKDEEWIVTTGRLVDTLETIARMQELPDDYVPVYGREINETARILRVPTPEVPVRIDCQKVEDNPHVTEIKCHRYGMAENDWPYTNNAVPWELTLPAETHEVIARLANRPQGQAEAKEAFIPVPPEWVKKLRISE